MNLHRCRVYKRLSTLSFLLRRQTDSEWHSSSSVDIRHPGMSGSPLRSALLAFIIMSPVALFTNAPAQVTTSFRGLVLTVRT